MRNSLPNDVVCCTSLSSFKYKSKDVNFQPFLKEHAVIEHSILLCMFCIYNVLYVFVK